MPLKRLNPKNHIKQSHKITGIKNKTWKIMGIDFKMC